jgi:hypothetical protein
MTRVTIVPDSSTKFGYRIDTIAITFTRGAVPEPSSLLLGIIALGNLGVEMRLLRPAGSRRRSSLASTREFGYEKSHRTQIGFLGR